MQKPAKAELFFLLKSSITINEMKERKTEIISMKLNFYFVHPRKT